MRYQISQEMDKIENNKTFYQKLKSGIKKAVIAYFVFGLIAGYTDYLTGRTTGHLSSDIYTGRKKPTILEKFIYEDIFKVSLEKKENER